MMADVVTDAGQTLIEPAESIRAEADTQPGQPTLRLVRKPKDNDPAA